MDTCPCVILICCALQALLGVGVERELTSALSIHLGHPHSPGSALLSRSLNSSVVLAYILFIWQLFLLGHWTSVSCSIIPQQYFS